MNLHQIVSPYIGGVNPMVSVGLRLSAGAGPTLPDGTRPVRYEAPGAFVGSITDSILTVSNVSDGLIKPGQTLATAGLDPGITVVAQQTGVEGGPGDYQISASQNLASTSFTTSLIAIAQIQPLTWRDLQQLDGLNLGGLKKAIYLNGDLNGVVRVALKGGDMVDTPDGGVWLVAQQLEGWNMTAGWTKAAIVLQDGA